MNFPALLGEFAPIDAQFQLNVWNVIVLVTAVVALLAALKRKPPLDSELTKLNLAIESLTQTVADLEKTQKSHATHASEIATLQKDVAFLKDRREEDGATQRRHIAHTVRDFTEGVTALRQEFSESVNKIRDSLTANTQQVERALGGVTGELKQLTSRVEGIERDMRS